LPRTADDIGNIFVKAIDPLAGQGEGYIFVFEAIFNFDADGWQGEIVGTTEGEERKLIVTRGADSLFDRADNRFGFYVSCRTSQHSGLAKATPASTPATNFYGQAIVNGFYIGDQTDRIGWHGSCYPPQDSLGYVGTVGTNRTIFGGIVKSGNVNAGDLRQIEEQFFFAQSGCFAFFDDETDFWQEFFSVAQGNEIKEVGVGFGVGSCRLSPGKHEWIVARCPFLPGEGNVCQSEHF
jgi:hypothetical protein